MVLLKSSCAPPHPFCTVLLARQIRALWFPMSPRGSFSRRWEETGSEAQVHNPLAAPCGTSQAGCFSTKGHSPSPELLQLTLRQDPVTAPFWPPQCRRASSVSSSRARNQPSSHSGITLHVGHTGSSGPRLVQKQSWDLNS